MNKLIFVVVALLAFGVGWYLFTPERIEYTAVVEDEVVALEEELVSLEAAVAAGTLSPAAANEARARIIARIEAITDAADASGKATLTDAQRVQLAGGLDRLKDILIRYQGTLVAVDATAGVGGDSVTADSGASLNRGGSSRGSLSAIAAEALITIEASLEEVIDDVVSEAELEELFDQSEEMEDFETGEMTDDPSDDTDPMMDDDTSSSSDGDDAGDVEMEMPADDSSTTEMEVSEDSETSMMDDGSTEASTETGAMMEVTDEEDPNAQ